MNKKSKLILDSLQNADNWQIVYAALNDMPSCNLLDMANMINHILHNRLHTEQQIDCQTPDIH